MGKRKREEDENAHTITALTKDSEQRKRSSGQKHLGATTETIQIVVGTYEKTLHGVQATTYRRANITPEQHSLVQFSDTFLLSPHSSAIRCLAISPPSTSNATRSQRLILASGASDQVVNLYHISREAPQRRDKTDTILIEEKVTENPRNRELGSLQHHSGSVSALYFTTRSKLLSASEDNTIAVARTKDWTVLSTIKVPIPKAHGRPSGDTAPLGGTPAGVNDFAVHPSMKLMVSVGKGERCMRLWNLVTGKKAGVLNFERELLQGVGEGRWASGEGRRVEWNAVGEEFIVAFERGCVVFGMDCKPKCRIIPSPGTKIHQVHYMTVAVDQETKEFLAVSTEDSRLLFYSTGSYADVETTEISGKPTTPVCEAVGQLGGIEEGLTSRTKDFEVLQMPNSKRWIIVTGSSDGAIRLWGIEESILWTNSTMDEGSSKAEVGHSPLEGPKSTEAKSGTPPKIRQVGQLLGTYEAGNRITCLKAFVMLEYSGANGCEDGGKLDTFNGFHTDGES